MGVAEKIMQLKTTLPAHCTLVAVSKTHPSSLIQEAYDAGQREFGENKVQELVNKYEELPKDIHWHMIGHLQRNKVKYIAPFVHLIQGVDAEKLLEEIQKQGEKHNRIINCLLQVHIAKEETKFGFNKAEIEGLLGSGAIQKMSNIRVLGLMGMATFTDDQVQVKAEFDSLKRLFEEIKISTLPANVRMEILSMGMSGDFELAITCGSTLIRVGSMLFGQREYL